MSGTMQGMNIELMRLLSEKLNIGESKPNYCLRVMRKDKEGGFENFPFEIPNVVSISVDRRYNMAADELKVVIYDKNGTLSPDYSPNKEYKGVEGLSRSGFKDVLVPFNRIELDLGYADELRRVFTGQIADVSINEGSQTIELTCKNMFRKLQKPIDPRDKKVLLYEDKPAKEIIKDLLDKAGVKEGEGYRIDTETVDGKDFVIPRAEFQLGMYYADAIQEILTIMSHRIFADQYGIINVKKQELYTQKDFHAVELDDYVNMTSGEYNLDPSFVRNRVVIQTNNGWQAFEDPFLLKYANNELISSGIEVPWAETEDQRWAVADKYFMDMRRKLRRITVAAKGNPTLQIGDLVKMSGLISTMTEKYMVTAIQSSYTASGYIDQIDLEYVGKADGHICEKAGGTYETVEDSVAGGGLFPALTSRRQQLVNYASQYLGTWYQWGGDSAHNRSHYGMDCSHYVWTVFEHFGLMDQYRTAAEMYKHCIPISASEAKEGDLVFFKPGSSISHVGIYIGNGKMFSARGKSSTTTVGLARMNNHKVQVNKVNDFGRNQLFARVKGL